MAGARTLDQKLGDVGRAFDVLRHTIVSDAARQFVAQGADVADVASLRSYQAMAHTVAAGDRAALIAAAILVSSPIKTPLDESLWEQEGPGAGGVDTEEPS